jgi:hypothetical protein
MTTENVIQAAIRLAVGRIKHARLFRNNRGLFWGGRVVRHDGSTVTLADARRVDCGLVNGASDLIGWTTVTVTPDMVGQTIAVFTAQEVKTLTGRIRPEQQNFIAQVTAAGGFAGVVRSPDDAVKMVRAV